MASEDATVANTSPEQNDGRSANEPTATIAGTTALYSVSSTRTSLSPGAHPPTILNPSKRERLWLPHE